MRPSAAEDPAQRGGAPKKSPTFAEFLMGEWLPAIARTVRPTTFVNYRLHVERHIVPALGQRSLRSVDGSTLNGFYAELLRKGRLKDNGPLSPTTVRRIHATLHRALKDAVRWGRVSKNPADDCDPPREQADDVVEMRTWDAHEVRFFIDAVRDDPFHAMWVLFATTGMRRGEVLGLAWRDVDLDKRQLAVRQSLVTVGYELHFSRPKTARGRRVIALDEHTAAVLGQHRLRQLKHKETCVGYQDGDLVFCGPDDAPLHPSAVSKLFKNLARSCGLPVIRLHDLRHTHATLALQAGIHPKIVSERLGHATVSLTLDVYSHALQSMQEEAAAQVGRLLFGEV
jgi:integrase